MNTFFLETTTFLRRKSRNQNKFAHEQISAHTHTVQLKIRGILLAFMEMHLEICSLYGSLTQKGSRPSLTFVRMS